MIAFLSSYMSVRLAKVLAYVVLPLLVLAAFYFALDAYGDSRFREGRAAENAAWKEAQDNLLAKAAKSSAKADREAIAAQMDQAAKVEEEKEKVDDAIANGTSPFDVLFPADSVPSR